MAWQMVGIADERAREPREGKERDEMGSQAKAGVCVCVSACADVRMHVCVFILRGWAMV